MDMIPQIGTAFILLLTLSWGVRFCVNVYYDIHILITDNERRLHEARTGNSTAASGRVFDAD